MQFVEFTNEDSRFIVTFFLLFGIRSYICTSIVPFSIWLSLFLLVLLLLRFLLLLVLLLLSLSLLSKITLSKAHRPETRAVRSVGLISGGPAKSAVKPRSKIRGFDAKYLWMMLPLFLKMASSVPSSSLFPPLFPLRFGPSGLLGVVGVPLLRSRFERGMAGVAVIVIVGRRMIGLDGG